MLQNRVIKLTTGKKLSNRPHIFTRTNSLPNHLQVHIKLLPLCTYPTHKNCLQDPRMKEVINAEMEINKLGVKYWDNSPPSILWLLQKSAQTAIVNDNLNAKALIHPNAGKPPEKGFQSGKKCFENYIWIIFRNKIQDCHGSEVAKSYKEARAQPGSWLWEKQFEWVPGVWGGELINFPFKSIPSIRRTW